MGRVGQAIDITAKIREAHRLAKGLHGEKFPAVVEPWRNLLRGVMREQKLNEVAAGLEMLKPARSMGGDAGVAMMMIMAAVVEEIGGAA